MTSYDKADQKALHGSSNALEESRRRQRGGGLPSHCDGDAEVAREWHHHGIRLERQVGEEQAGWSVSRSAVLARYASSYFPSEARSLIVLEAIEQSDESPSAVEPGMKHAQADLSATPSSALNHLTFSFTFDGTLEDYNENVVEGRAATSTAAE